MNIEVIDCTQVAINTSVSKPINDHDDEAENTCGPFHEYIRT